MIKRFSLAIVLGSIASFLFLLPLVSHAKTVEITAWHSWLFRSSDRDFLLDLVDTFNAANPDIQVELVTQSVYPEDFITSYAGGVKPDVIFSTYTWNPGYAAAGMLVDLTPYAERDGLSDEMRSDFVPVAGTAWWDGNLYAVPTSAGGGVMYYNPSVLDSAGISEPAKGWTWEDLRSKASGVLQMDSAGAISRYGILSQHPLSTVMPFLVQSGVRFFDSKYRESIIGDSDAASTVLSYLRDLVSSDLITRLPFAEAVEQMASNRSGFYMDVPRLPQLREQSEDAFRIAPALTGSVGQPATYGDWVGWAAVKSGDADREAAAWEFIKYMTGPEVLARHAAGFGSIPARFSAMRSPVFEESIEADPDVQTLAFDVISHASLEGLFGHPYTEWSSQVLSPFLNAALEKAEMRPIPEIIAEADHLTQVSIDEYWSSR